MDTGHGPEEHQEEYSFLQETFKDEQLSLKKLLLKVSKYVGLGLVFGVAACIAFHALKPWAEDTFQAEPDEVEIQSKEEDDVDETQDTQGEPQEAVKQELTLEDYYILNNELKQMAKEAQKSVVMVSGMAENADWTSGQMGVLDSASGLIVADNGRELLILSSYSVAKDTQIFQVEFVDGTKHQASFKQKDSNLDMAVFSVAKGGISEATWENISIAEFGNSNRLGQGRTLIAAGQPFGFENGVGYGVASSLTETITYADGEYDIIVTDMAASEAGSGFLFDIYGNVMGYIDSKLIDRLDASTLVAYGISDITDEIELMSNGKHVPYAGIVGIMVTEETAELHGIPVGLYVTEVETDSPAMKAGIQNGDIITEVGETKITSLDIYHDALYKLEAGNSVKFNGQRYGTEKYVDVDFTVTIGIKE